MLSNACSYNYILGFTPVFFDIYITCKAMNCRNVVVIYLSSVTGQEVFSEQAYDEKSDLWSLGCLLHELCTLAPPFTARDQQTLAAKVAIRMW